MICVGCGFDVELGELEPAIAGEATHHPFPETRETSRAPPYYRGELEAELEITLACPECERVIYRDHLNLQAHDIQLRKDT